MSRHFAFATLCLFVVSLSLGGGSARGVRMCGSRLANLLTLICEKRGGFHTPQVRRAASSAIAKRNTLFGVLSPALKRAEEESAASEDDILKIEGGVVDECCKRSCSFATLVSYCANARPDVDMDEIISSVHEPETSEQQASTVAMPSKPIASVIAKPLVSEGGAGAGRPNLGVFARDRPVFIVLSQLHQDDEDQLGEYRY